VLRPIPALGFPPTKRIQGLSVLASPLLWGVSSVGHTSSARGLDEEGSTSLPPTTSPDQPQLPPEAQTALARELAARQGSALVFGAEAPGPAAVGTDSERPSELSGHAELPRFTQSGNAQGGCVTVALREPCAMYTSACAALAWSTY